MDRTDAYEAYSKDKIKRAEQCLIDNGIEPDEAETVLQALGYILCLYLKSHLILIKGY